MRDIHQELLTKCEPYEARNSFIADVCSKARAYDGFTERQFWAVENAVNKIIERDASNANRAPSNSQHIGQIGQRIRGIKVTVLNVFTGINEMKFNYYQSDYFHITTMEDKDGNVLVVKSSSFQPKKGETLVITGTVKAHSSYKGMAQTQLSRVAVAA